MERTETKSQLANPFFADLVVLARGLNPFPYRTRPLNPSAPMVLSLKAWKSRSLPGLPRTDFSLHDDRYENPPRETAAGFLCSAIGRLPGVPEQMSRQDVVRQHFLNFLPLPHGHGSLRPTRRSGLRTGS
jgi:hypothetical protein